MATTYHRELPAVGWSHLSLSARRNLRGWRAEGLGEDIPHVLRRESSRRRQVADFSGCKRQIQYSEKMCKTLPALFPGDS